MKLIEPILADMAAITTIRRDIHAHPELCFQEERTADVIAKALTEWGIPIHRGLGKTGVIGIVKNGSSSRAVGLRADIDALPMTEHNTFAHASRHPGKMHACGHDGHTAMLLAAAKHLSQHCLLYTSRKCSSTTVKRSSRAKPRTTWALSGATATGLLL